MEKNTKKNENNNISEMLLEAVELQKKINKSFKFFNDNEDKLSLDHKDRINDIIDEAKLSLIPELDKLKNITKNEK